MIELRLHGRGGQGALLFTEVFVAALVKEGKWGQGFPMFAGERRGAPMSCNLRIDDQRVRQRERITKPDVAVVLDNVLVYKAPWHSGLKEGGIAILNVPKSPDELLKEITLPVKLSKLATVDATNIAIRNFGPSALPITNSSMMGATVKVTECLKLESLIDAIKHAWPGRIGESNAACATDAYNEVKIKVF